MRKLPLFATAVAAMLIGTQALAAKAQLPTPVYSWTGFYVGGDIGYGSGNANGNLNDPAIAIVFSGLGSLPASFAESLRPKGVIGGVQFGYSYQLNPTWVVGLESDFQAAGQNASSNQSASTGGGSVAGGGFTASSVATTFESRISWFGTVRGRAGILINSTTLFYSTGGLAFGSVKLAGSGSATINLTACIPGLGCIPTGGASGAFAFSQSATKSGWTLGCGVEGALAGNWTWKAEYLYFSLGSVSGSVADNFGGVASWNAKFNDNIVRVGLNYKFSN